ncbi:MAG TPA: oligosaccharide flippase family protein [Alphaproteobacteria bacterium]|nr:oligosaccharide flippase family protein [Alphaproteobacteria bacterium]
MKDITVSFAATAFIQLANVATGLLAARLLLPEGRGELAAIMLWAGLVAELGSLGLYDALLYRAASGLARPRALFAAMAMFTLMLSAALIAIGLVVMLVVFADDAPELRRLALFYLAGYLPSYLAALFVAALFQGRIEMLAWNVVRALVPAAYLIAIGVALLLGSADVAGFAWAFVAAHVASTALGLALAAGRGWIGFSAEWSELRALLAYGIKVHVGELLNTVRQRLDQALVSLWLPASDLGLYVVALTVANAPQILVHTIANVAFPKISQQTTPEGKLVVFGRYFRFAMATTLATVALLAGLSGWLVPLLFGAPFAPAVPVTYILLLGALPFAAKLMFIQALKAWDRSLLISRAELYGLAVAAGALVVLLPRLGLAGAAWSLVAAQCVAAAAMALSMTRDLGLGLGSLCRPTSDDWRLAVEFARRLAGRGA